MVPGLDPPSCPYPSCQVQPCQAQVVLELELEL